MALRMRYFCRVAIALLIAFAPIGGSTIFAQQGDAIEQPSNAADPLALKQEMIRDRFKRFEDRIYRLREQLSDTEPANAARLERVLEQAGETGVADQLDKLIELLNDPSRVSMAADAQAKWLADADRLLNILLEQDSDNKERKEEIERLKEYQEKLNKILEQERALRQEAADAITAKRLGMQLDQAIKRLDALIEKQGQISKATENREGDPSELSDPQAQTGDEAARLAESLEALSKEPPADSPQSEAMQKASEQAGEAAKDVKAGSQSMSQAAQQLGGGQKPSAQKEQADATEALKKAKEKLEQAKRELEQKSGTKNQAENQKQNSDAAKKLSDQMKEESEGEGGEQGDPQGEGQGEKKSGGKSGKSTPGLQNLDKAQQEMDGASESLEKGDPEGATPKQDAAIRELEQAQRELENALQQLRQEERAEMLRDLEARFREMLDKQRLINDSTGKLDQIGKAQFGRAQQLELADLATQQRDLAGQAETCGHILDEEGTTIVFPRVVTQIAEDMGFVGDRLAEFEVGELTQTVEAEIVDALEQLLEAVKKMQEENKAGGGGQQKSGGGNKENQKLLPTSAEYKLLKSSQVRVNTRTTTIEKTRSEKSEAAESIAKALKAVATRQKECHDIALQMRDRERTP